MLAVLLGRRRQGKSTLALALARIGRKTVVIFDPNDQYGNIERITDLSAWMESSTPDSIGRIVASPPETDWENIVAILDGGSWAWGEYALIVDECSMLMRPSKVHWALERYARTSPKDVDVFLTSHRPVDVHPLFRSLATDWFFFQQHLELDLTKITDTFGADVAAAAAQLPPYHVLHYWLDPGGVPRWEVWDRPEEWFIDIGRRT